MNLFWGVAFICFSAILFGIEIVFFRNPQLPRWAEGFVFISTAVVVIIGFGSTGLILITFALKDMRALGWDHLLSSASVVGATALGLWALHIPRRLRNFAERKTVILPLAQVEAQPGLSDGMGPGKGRLAA